tara:strand:- start:183 stop:794 length:612 start_codon:yes stop_codon:yes gene_type:complete
MNKLTLPILFLVTIITSCSTPITTYNNSYVPYPAPDSNLSQIDGKILVVMDVQDEFRTIESSPSSFTGGAATAVFAVGKITKEITLLTYSRLFTEGSDFSNNFIKGYVVTVTPSIAYFDYKFDQLSSLGMAITPRVEVNLLLNIRDSSGKSIFTQTYYSGDTAGSTYMFSASPFEEVNEALHKAIHNVVSQSKSDLLKYANKN